MENQNTTESQEKVTVAESTIAPIETQETRSSEKRVKSIDELEEDLKRLKLENQILEESNRYKERLQPQIGKSSWLNEFFWWCAGVDKEIIRQCPTDHAKYVGIGGTILFTAVMATLSAGYALSTVFNDHPYVAICFGIIWGLSIFNLDRFIVNTMYSDGKANISWLEFRSGLPRIIMAIFLGVVISTPLELKIFEDGIDIKIEQEKDRLINEKIKDVALEKKAVEKKRIDVLSGSLTDIYDTSSDEEKNKQNKIDVEIKKLEDKKTAEQEKKERLENQKKALNGEIYILYSHGTHQDSVAAWGKIRNRRNIESDIVRRNTVIADLEAQIQSKYNIISASQQSVTDINNAKIQSMQEEAKRLQSIADSLQTLIASAKIKHTGLEWPEKRIKEEGSFRDKLDLEYKGFEAKMDAFSQMKEFHFNGSFFPWKWDFNSTAISSLFIMLLFVIIETAPTFFKMMMEDGPYDHLKHAKMAETKALAIKLESLTNDDINTELSISQARNQRRLEAEMKANEDVMDKIADTQSELIKTSIALWREEELKKIKENPTIYLKQNNEKG